MTFPSFKHIHMVGIGGTGMCGIAEVLLNLGYQITGSDVKNSEAVRRLRRRGAKIKIGHLAKNVGDADIVVVSTAISSGNPEIKYAEKKNIPIVPRAEMLAELMRLKYSVAIAGTHGKTTTTSLVGMMLDDAKLDPTLIIGGRLNSIRSNARLGKGDFFVAEADESDGSFLKLSPTIAVITNIDPEHMENYGSLSGLKKAFVEFANKVPFYGSAIVCKDSANVRGILPKLGRRVVTYGQSGADFTLGKVTQEKDRLVFSVCKGGDELGRIKINAVGTHHAVNALAAVAVGHELGLSFSAIRKGLARFSGVARRFQVLFKKGPIVVDDYAHHPVEIGATIEAAKKGWPDARIIAVCQPHRYSRLSYHFKGFVSALAQADAVMVTEVYSAGERKLAGYSGEKLWKEMNKRFPRRQLAYTKETKEVVPALLPWCRPGDLVLFLGAGDITRQAHLLADTLKRV